MTRPLRSPFGAMLRDARRTKGLSQTELAAKVALRFSADPSVAELGVISDRAIANIEAAKQHTSEFVRPRPETVKVLMLALDIDPESKAGADMLKAAALTHRRKPAIAAASETMIDVPFILGGRESQRDSLLSNWEQVKSGKPRIQLIEGTAGVGKTRLVEEFCSVIRSGTNSALISVGECSSGAASNEPYLPWRRALSYFLREDLAGDPNNHGRFATAELLLGSIHNLGNVIIDFQVFEQWLLKKTPEKMSEFLRLRDTPASTNTTGRYDQIMSIIATVTATQPMVIVLEDLHWADESSCSLLLHLQRQMRLHTELPLMIIGTYRSSDLVVPNGRHPLQHVINEMGRQVGSVVVSLETMPGSDSGRQFVVELIESFPMSTEDREKITALLFKRTHGHPLFTTELLNRLIETGGLAPRADGLWELNHNGITIELPIKMRAIIDERLQRLSDQELSLVEAASVHGGPFSADDIPPVSGLTQNDISILIDRHLVERHRVFRFHEGEPGRDYEFSHQVIAETVYDSLSPNRRRALHRATAEHLAAKLQHRQFKGSPQATHHFEQAEMYAEAAHQALLTSYETLATLDHDLTLIWVDQSERLALLANDDRRLWAARIRRAHVLRSMGSIHEARAVGHDLKIQAQRAGDPVLEAEAYEVLALVEYHLGNLDEAYDLWTQCIDLFQRVERFDRVSASQSMLSHVACRLGRIDIAITHARAGWASAPDRTRDGLGAEALLAEGNALAELGQYDESIKLFQRSLSNYRITGEMRGILLSRMNIGLAHVRLGNQEEGRKILAELMDEIAPLYVPRLEAFVYFYTGLADEAAHNYETAMHWYQRAAETRLSSGMDTMIGDDLGGILRVAVKRETDVEYHLEQLEQWWRRCDLRALEDPLSVIVALVAAYEYLGHDNLVHTTLAEGADLFLSRVAQIQDISIREQYVRNNAIGNMFLQRVKETDPLQS